MAEIERAALSAQWRIPDLEVLRRDTPAWQAPRNNRGAPSGWRFTTDDARIRLRRLYPSVDDWLTTSDLNSQAKILFRGLNQPHSYMEGHRGD
jgi:hypothetical protein